MQPRLLSTLLVIALLPSCAYVQTHKNVREAGQRYHGYSLPQPQQIYQSQNRWFVAASPASFRQHHDLVHDNVFLKSHEPVMLLQQQEDSLAFYPISPYTATVLLRPDGYVELTTLSRELQNDPSLWVKSLPHATAHAVKAQVVGDATCAITYQPTPDSPPLSSRFLSALELAFVDVPGTVLYNVAVPFAAPFVFFYEFLND